MPFNGFFISGAAFFIAGVFASRYVKPVLDKVIADVKVVIDFVHSKTNKPTA